MQKLVIVESPSKEKSLQKYLGEGYRVKASKGHVVDLPKKELGVDVEKRYKPKYVVTKKAALIALKKAFGKKSTLVLAVDPDREGEAIGWHVAQRLGVISASGRVKKGKKLERIVFTEITESAVQEAAKKPREIDMSLVDAQQTRRILDRLVGYKLSPLIWKKIRFGLSAGRVQSVAVKLIVDKERERDKFKSDEFWKLDSYLAEKKGSVPKILIHKDEEGKDAKKDKQESLKGTKFSLAKIDGKTAAVKNEKAVKKIIDETKKGKWVITGLTKEDSKRKPTPPLKTSTMQQAAANKLGYSAKKTMMTAQKLYEAGLITYMRTDSISMGKKAISQARKVIETKYGKDYVPEKATLYKTTSKVAQEAHEAIRPTNFSKFPDKTKLKGSEKKLYELIWKKALASQASEAKVELTSVKIDVKKYMFEAKAQRIIFPGFMAIHSDLAKEFILPKLKEGQELFARGLLAAQNFTQPPARYTEATLIKALEKHGIGRPSTYSTIISTIQQRKYAEKEQRYFIPTDTGKIVTKLLEDHFPEIVDLDFTSEMEEDLDAVADGKKVWQDIVDAFYKPFAKTLEKKEKSINREDYNVLGDAPKSIKCPECKSSMIIKLGRYGRFYSCSKWPKCKGMLSEDGQTKEDLEKRAKSKKFLSIYQPAPKTDDERDYALKSGKYGEFWAHPDYPKVKDARPLEYQKEIFTKIYGRTPKAEDGTKMELRRGRFGEFWAHPDYPEVKEAQKIDKKKVAAKKKELKITS